MEKENNFISNGVWLVVQLSNSHSDQLMPFYYFSTTFFTLSLSLFSSYRNFFLKKTFFFFFLSSKETFFGAHFKHLFPIHEVGIEQCANRVFCRTFTNERKSWEHVVLFQKYHWKILMIGVKRMYSIIIYYNIVN